MASLRRIRRRACEGKERFSTKEEATAFLKSSLWRMRQQGVSRRGMQVYRCGFCGGFHIGHRPGGRSISASQVSRKKGAPARAR